MLKAKRTQAFVVLWLFIAAVAQFAILIGHGFSWKMALLDAGLSFILVVLSSQVIFLIQTHFNAKNAFNIPHFGMVLGSTIFYQAIFNTLIQFIIGKLAWDHLVFPFEGSRAIIVLLIHALIVGFWWIYKKEQTQAKILKQLVDQERALVKAELDNLHQQIQPHFLFNSLNSIGALTELNPSEANRMIHLLSDFLRGSLRKDIQTLVALNEEIDQAKRYLEIEKIRFGQRLNVSFEIDETCIEAKVPPLIIQPVLENAIKFGLYGSTEAVMIQLNFHCQQNCLRIEIINPYDPEWVHERHGKGFGLTSIQRRLSLVYNQHDLLKTSSKDNLFYTQITIPQ